MNAVTFKCKLPMKGKKKEKEFLNNFLPLLLQDNPDLVTSTYRLLCGLKRTSDMKSKGNEWANGMDPGFQGFPDPFATLENRGVGFHTFWTADRVRRSTRLG
jgi:hypothetical protein